MLQKIIGEIQNQVYGKKLTRKNLAMSNKMTFAIIWFTVTLS